MHYKVHSNKQFLTLTTEDIVTKIHHHPKKFVCHVCSALNMRHYLTVTISRHTDILCSM